MYILLSFITLVPLIILTAWTLRKHYEIWLFTTHHTSTIVVLLYPLICASSYSVGLLLGDRYIYHTLIIGLYESFVLYHLYTLYMFHFDRIAPHHFKVDLSFRHCDKCNIDDTYKLTKDNYLYSLCPRQCIPTSLTYYAIVQHVIARMLNIFLLPFLCEATSHCDTTARVLYVFTHLSFILAALDLFYIAYVFEVILIAYDTLMKCSLICLPMLLTQYQSLLFHGHDNLISLMVNVEMFFIVLYFYWVFPHDDFSINGLITSPE